MLGIQALGIQALGIQANSLHPATLEVNTLWTLSSFWMSATAEGFHKRQQYSSLDRTTREL